MTKCNKIIAFNMRVLITYRMDFVILMMSSNGNTSRVTGHLCGEFTGPQWIPDTKAVDAELWCFLWSARLSKQSWGWWFETPSCSLWRHCNADAHLKHANLMQSDAKLRHVILMYWAHWRCQVKPRHSIPHMHQIVLCTNDRIRVLNRRVTSTDLNNRRSRARRRDAGILIHSARFRGSV